MAKFYCLRDPIAPVAPSVSFGASASVALLTTFPAQRCLPERSEGRLVAGAGLSKLHICTNLLPPSGKPVEMDGGGQLSLATGGSLVSLSRSGRGAVSKRSVEVRGRISEWSPKSRMRLRYAMAGLDRAALGRGFFLTLTYPGEFPAPENSEIYQTHRHRFTQALQREISRECAGFWKLEFQARGAAHFHLLLLGYEGDVVRLREWVARRWYELVGSGDERHLRAGTQTDAARGVAGAMCYLAKYVSKADQTLPGNFSGRYWGRFNGAALPVAPVTTVDLSASDSAKVSRWMRRIVMGHVMDARWRAWIRSSPFFSRDDGWTRLSAERAMKGLPMLTYSRRWKNFDLPDGARAQCPPGSEIWHGKSDFEYPPPPSRWRLRANSTVRLMCDADSFAAAVLTAVERGILGSGALGTIPLRGIHRDGPLP